MTQEPPEDWERTWNYWPLLAVMLLGYVILTQFVKTWFYRRFGE